jgi:hypothetical protein
MYPTKEEAEKRIKMIDLQLDAIESTQAKVVISQMNLNLEKKFLLMIINSEVEQNARHY